MESFFAEGGLRRRHPILVSAVDDDRCALSRQAKCAGSANTRVGRRTGDDGHPTGETRTPGRGVHIFGINRVRIGWSCSLHAVRHSLNNHRLSDSALITRVLASTSTYAVEVAPLLCERHLLSARSIPVRSVRLPKHDTPPAVDPPKTRTDATRLSEWRRFATYCRRSGQPGRRVGRSVPPANYLNRAGGFQGRR